MTLAFLNPSRSFDEARNAVGFIGHDGIFEIRFFVEVSALARSCPQGGNVSEDQYLSAFDTMREAICDAARNVYSAHGRNLNTLTSADLR